MAGIGKSSFQDTEFTRRVLANKPKKKRKVSKWIKIASLGILGLLFFLYLSLGELRFFANHAFSLGFFEKNYLILLQNNYELRPTGGFITGYGELKVKMGQISELSFHNSYEIDTETYVEPPYPHAELLESEWYEGYSFRDANWNPHFPTAAQELISFYAAKFPEKDVDGIIVINFSMLEKLVDALGGISVDGQELHKDNLFKVLTDNVNDVDRHSIEALAERKSVLGQLAGPLLSKMKWNPYTTKDVVVEALNNKDMYLWFAKKRLQEKIEEKGWGNTFEAPETGDFLGVNLANLGGKKTDRYLMKEVFHYIDLKQEMPRLTTQVVLKYPGEANIYAGDYSGYLRLYLPGNAVLVGENPDGMIEEERDNFKIAGVIVRVVPGETQTLTFNYELPESRMEAGEYELRIIPQSGDRKFYHIFAESLVDTQMTSDSFEAKENKAFWQGELKDEITLQLKVLPDSTPPYPIEQVFDNLNVISIYWAENLNEEVASNPKNYKVIDLNQTNSEVTDNVEVTGAEVVAGNIVKLYLEGTTTQDLEAYQIQMTGLQDLAGNVISPEPKLITAIQRFD